MKVDLGHRLREHILAIYCEDSVLMAADLWVKKILKAARLEKSDRLPPAHRNLWDESDVALITYGDSILDQHQAPLEVLHHFLAQHVGSLISWLHVLPFHPWTSDDGFSVLDYSSINEALGEWSDITCLSNNYRLMADLVLNHCSSRSAWFDNFRQGRSPGAGYFYVPDPEFDVTQVVRPRTSPLLNAFETNEGIKEVWCTFSPDQVDFNFANPQVLVEFVSVIRQLLDAGVRIFRLDAVAFLWKESGTTCMNLPKTHELVRLIRTVIECAQSDAIIITETNVPNRENLSYFGNANEAHGIYNFSLPPLLVHALITGNSRCLSEWMMSMPPTQDGTVYFNFIASHDGIGLRPIEGLLDRSEVDVLLATMESFGGRVSWRNTSAGEWRPYEINIALFDALQGTVAGSDRWGVTRFICAHAIMLGLEGIPAIYIHSLLGTRNDINRLHHTSQNRAINRHQWSLKSLLVELGDPSSTHHQVFRELKFLIELRRVQSAFHPNAPQFMLHLGHELFGFWRQSLDRRQSLFCVHNLTAREQVLSLSRLNLVLMHEWRELISNTVIDESMLEWKLVPYQTLWISNL